MTVQTLTGSSIQDALTRAREELGDDVVLMESTPATADAPAKIAVMLDASAADAEPQRTPHGHVPKPPTDGSLPVPDADDGEPPSGTSGADTTDFGYGGADEESPSPADGSAADSSDDDHNFGQILEQQRKTGRGRIFPLSEDASNSPESGASPRTVPPDRSPFSERPRGPSSPETAQSVPWSSHPLYRVLLSKGLRPDTTDRIFEELSDRGIDLTNNPPEDLRWACAQLLCRRIDVAEQVRPPPGPLALIGPSGAGKTSLILKLATDSQLLGNSDPVVLHLHPDPESATAYQNPTNLYRQFGLPVQNVQTETDMARALNRAENFGQVLIDTPPLPLPLDEGRSTLRRLRDLLAPIRSLDVHFVLSATHAFDSLDETALPHLPLQPNAASITHLDEVPTWGRIVEWLLTLDLPVRFVSDGPRVPDDARTFTLKWFVGDVMDL